VPDHFIHPADHTLTPDQPPRNDDLTERSGQPWR
jgi:hypothetical protein